MKQTANDILDRAEIGIRTKGYHAVSFRDLADDLGIKSASVHYHFRHKEDLGLALVERYETEFFELLEQQSDGETHWENLMRSFCDQYRSALTGSDAICLCGLLGAEIFGLPKPLGEAVEQFFLRNIEWVENALPDELAQGERKAKAQAIIAGLQGAMMLANSLGDYAIFDSVVENLMSDLGRSTT